MEVLPRRNEDKQDQEWVRHEMMWTESQRGQSWDGSDVQKDAEVGSARCKDVYRQDTKLACVREEDAMLSPPPMMQCCCYQRTSSCIFVFFTFLFSLRKLWTVYWRQQAILLKRVILLFVFFPYFYAIVSESYSAVHRATAAVTSVISPPVNVRNIVAHAVNPWNDKTHNAETLPHPWWREYKREAYLGCSLYPCVKKRSSPRAGAVRLDGRQKNCWTTHCWSPPSGHLRKAGRDEQPLLDIIKHLGYNTLSNIVSGQMLSNKRNFSPFW